MGAHLHHREVKKERPKCTHSRFCEVYTPHEADFTITVTCPKECGWIAKDRPYCQKALNARLEKKDRHTKCPNPDCQYEGELLEWPITVTDLREEGAAVADEIKLPCEAKAPWNKGCKDGKHKAAYQVYGACPSTMCRYEIDGFWCFEASVILDRIKSDGEDGDGALTCPHCGTVSEVRDWKISFNATSAKFLAIKEE